MSATELSYGGITVVVRHTNESQNCLGENKKVNK